MKVYINKINVSQFKYLFRDGIITAIRNVFQYLNILVYNGALDSTY